MGGGGVNYSIHISGVAKSVLLNTKVHGRHLHSWPAICQHDYQENKLSLFDFGRLAVALEISIVGDQLCLLGTHYEVSK